MIGIYNAVAIQPEVLSVRNRDEIRCNLDRLLQLIEFSVSFYSTEVPVRLIALPEYCLQGYDLREQHADLIKNRAITIPGEETERLGERARKYGIYIGAAAWATDPDFPGRLFTMNFLVGPSGDIALRAYKLTAGMWASSPHDLWDEFVEKRGDSLNAFFPVADTDIGRIGMFSCYDGTLPEIARGFAVNGAEILIRPTAWSDENISPPLELHELTNRARAYENACYVISPNWGMEIGETPMPRHVWTGDSLIVDYRGRIVSRAMKSGETAIAGLINVEELRAWRTTASRGNLLPNVRSELFAKIYEHPIRPKNLFLDRPPQSRADVRVLHHEAMRTLLERGVFREPEIAVHGKRL